MGTEWNHVLEHVHWMHAIDDYFFQCEVFELAYSVLETLGDQVCPLQTVSFCQPV